MKRHADPLARFWIHPLTVETYLEQATDGSDTFAGPAEVLGFLDEKITTVRDHDGVEQVSSSTFYAPATAAARFTARSRVAVRGRIAEALAVSLQDGGSNGLPDHVVVSLT